VGARAQVKGTSLIVFDTNVVVSALVLQSEHVVWLRDAWRQAKLVPLVSRATATELLRMLAYAKFKLSAQEQHDLLEDFLPYAETIAEPRARGAVAETRDPNDGMFLVLAYAAKADALVSGDADLLAIAGESKIPIITPLALRERFAVT
jgi:uncharacterized protein